MTREFTHDFHIVLQWIPSDYSYMLTLVALPCSVSASTDYHWSQWLNNYCCQHGGLQIWHLQTKPMTILQRSNWKARIGSTMVPVIIFLDGYMALPKMKNWIITIYPLSICMCVLIIIQSIYSIIPYVIETQMVRMKANQFECIFVYLLSLWITEIRYE